MTGQTSFFFPPPSSARRCHFWASTEKEPQREKTTKTGRRRRSHFKRASNEPHKHDGFISPLTARRSPSFLWMKQPSFGAPLRLLPNPQTKVLLLPSPSSSSSLPTCLSSSVLFVSQLSFSTHLRWGADTTADCEQSRGDSEGGDMMRQIYLLLGQ